jgi:pimeloyl-ACP methyl ester carboxylesterase
MTIFDMPEPTRDDNIMRDGLRIRYRVFEPTAGADETLLMLPPWIVTSSDIWASQVGELSRRYRVVVLDGRGGGGSDRPQSVEAYRSEAYAGDALAVLDAVGAAAAHLAGLSFGGHLAALLAARHPERVTSTTLIAPSAPFGPSNAAMRAENFLAPWNGAGGWALFNRSAWLSDYERFARFFVAEAVGEPGWDALVTRGLRWALEVDGRTLVHTMIARAQTAVEEGEELYRQIRCPVQVLHGELDRIVPVGKGRHVAALLDAPFRLFTGAGHVPLQTRADEINRTLVMFLGMHGRHAARPAVA